MARTLAQIASEALELSEEDRLVLGERLLHSVPPNQEVLEAWNVEVARRVDDIKSGKVGGILAGDVEAELREIAS